MKKKKSFTLRSLSLQKGIVSAVEKDPAGKVDILKQYRLTPAAYQSMKSRLKTKGHLKELDAPDYGVPEKTERVNNPDKVRQTRLRMLIEMLLEELDAVGY